MRYKISKNLRQDLLKACWETIGGVTFIDIFLVILSISVRFGLVVSNSLAPDLPVGTVVLYGLIWPLHVIDRIYVFFRGTSPLANFLVRNNMIVAHYNYGQNNLPYKIYHRVYDYFDHVNQTLLIFGTLRGQNYTLHKNNNALSHFTFHSSETIPLRDIYGIHVCNIFYLTGLPYHIFKLIVENSLAPVLGLLLFEIFLRYVVYNSATTKEEAQYLQLIKLITNTFVYHVCTRLNLQYPTWLIDTSEQEVTNEPIHVLHSDAQSETEDAMDSDTELQI